MYLHIIILSIILIILFGNAKYIENISKKYSDNSKWLSIIFWLVYYLGAFFISISFYVLILDFINVFFSDQIILWVWVFNIICLLIVYWKYKKKYRKFIIIDSLLFCNWLIVTSLAIHFYLELDISNVQNLIWLSMIFLFMIWALISQYLYMRESRS